MLDTVKRIAQQTGEAGAPAAILFGTVVSAAPLTVRLDNRFDISGEALLVPRELRAGEYRTHTHGGTGGTESYYGLAAGEKVALLRNAGGQQFYVLGRV